MTGSGPFKIVEFKPGVKTVYAKNTDYVPRKTRQRPGRRQGRQRRQGRMERHARRLTTANALLGGEIDFVEQFPYDLLPMVEGNRI